MPIYYKGAGPGDYWHINDATKIGFVPRDPSIPSSCDQLIKHIKHGTIHSPFISLTKSYGIAEDYAKWGNAILATKSNPGYVYEIELNNPLPGGMQIIDPMKEIVIPSPVPPSNIPYHHNGAQNFLLGIVSPGLMRHYLRAPAPLPPHSVGTRMSPGLSKELECIVRVLRDSEVLVVGNIPKTAVMAKFSIY